MRESDIEKHLVKRVKVLGGEVRKVQCIGRRGAPDRLVMLPTRFAGALHPPGRSITPAVSVWVELKAPGLGPEPHQAREHALMRKMGQHVVVIDSIEGVEELLK